MKAKALLGELREANLVGEVTGARRSYAVFEGPRYYVVVTFSTAVAGNFTLIDKKAVDYVRSAFAGKKDLTSVELLRRIKKRKYARERFDALYILHILEASGEATRRTAKAPARGFLFSLRRRR